MTDPVREIWKHDRRYSMEAYQFLFDSLDQAVKLAGRDQEAGTGRHVTGQELLEGMRVHATNLFGPLAGAVWRSWGVHTTLDWGRIVFLLVDAKLLNRQDTDTIQDFDKGFDYEEAFVKSYRPSLPSEIQVSPTGDDE